jgi:hypothetical protein
MPRPADGGAVPNAELGDYSNINLELKRNNHGPRRIGAGVGMHQNDKGVRMPFAAVRLAGPRAVSAFPSNAESE